MSCADEGERTQSKQGEPHSMKTVDIKGYTDKMRKTLVSLQKEKEKEKDMEKEISDPGTLPPSVVRQRPRGVFCCLATLIGR